MEGTEGIDFAVVVDLEAEAPMKVGAAPGCTSGSGAV